MAKLTDVDKIMRCLKSGEDMPPALAERMKRLNAARELLFGVENMNTHQIAKQIRDNFSVSLGQARADVQEAKKLFPMLDPVDRAFEKAWLIDSSKKNIAAARLKGDLKTVATEHKNLAMLFNFSEDEENAQPPSLIVNVMNFNPALIGAREMPDDQLDRLIEDTVAEDVTEEEKMLAQDWALPTEVKKE
jgi:hypothetical protein